jgi:hypothetical protein
MELIYDSLLIPDFYNSSNQTSKTNTYGLIKQLNCELQTSFSGLWPGYIYEIVLQKYLICLGSWKIEVVTICPLKTTCLGSPTLTESTLIVIQDRMHCL